MDIRLVCLNCDRAIEIPSAGEDHPCPLCGALVSVELPPEPDVPGLASAFVYPFSTVGSVLFLVLMAPLWGFFRSSGSALFGCLGHILIGGYVAAWLWDILSTTAMGKHQAPAAPMPTDLWETAGSFFRFFGALLVAFAPAAIAATALFAYDIPKESPLNVVTAALAVAGIFYYPMALLLIGFSERWIGSLHFIFAVRSILLIKRDYLLCCVFFLVTFGVSTGLETAVAALPRDLPVAAVIGAHAANAFVELALYAIQMRAVGLVYLANKDRLGWFR
ncbi:MAG TPA: hypothetical protein VF950_28655 [Planctomycetota bacterium]